MLKDSGIDLGDGTKKAKEDFTKLLQKIANGEIIADVKIVHNAKAFLDEYTKEMDYRKDISLFAGLKLKIKDLLKKIIPGMKPSKELLKSALSSIANDPDKKVNKLATDHNKAIAIAKEEQSNIEAFQVQEKFSKLVGFSSKILGKNIERGEATEKLANSLGMFANIGAHLATFTAMEKDLTLGVISPILYYGATSTALSVASIGGGIAAATYGLCKIAKWFATSSAFEQKAAINIADECSAKANKIFSSNQHMMEYQNRASSITKFSTACAHEEVLESDLSYLDLLLCNTAEQGTNMAFKDRIIMEQERLAQQYI